jgi:hypothetical protein
MARQFLTGLNLNKNELLNARVQNLANDPSNPVLGQIYFNTSLNEMRVYNGTEFEAVGLNGVTASAAEINILDGATLSTTELNYVDGVTSGIQSQLDAKAPLNTPSFTGDVTLLTGDLVFKTGTSFSTTLNHEQLGEDVTITLPSNSGTVILSTDTVNALTAPTASFSMNSQKITNLATPTGDSDAATKGYVDAARSGLDVKASVRAATTDSEGFSVTSPTTLTVDGVELQIGDRFLVKDANTGVGAPPPAAPELNGIYVVTSVTPPAISRASDADTSAKVTSGMFTFVSEGTVNADSGWVLTTNDPITLGTTELAFAQFSGAGQITAGDGLTKDGNTLNAVGTADRITVNADSIDIASTYSGQDSITTVGTVVFGVWEASDVAVAHGGTGASDAAGAKTNLGFMTRYAASNELLVPSSGIVSWAVTHSLGTKDVTVQVYDLATDAEVEVDVVRTSTSVVTLSWVASANVDADSYRVVIVG